MLIDKPLCAVKTCRYCFDGNCTNETAYNKCPVKELQAEIERLKAKTAGDNKIPLKW